MIVRRHLIPNIEYIMIKLALTAALSCAKIVPHFFNRAWLFSIIMQFSSIFSYILSELFPVIIVAKVACCSPELISKAL